MMIDVVKRAVKLHKNRQTSPTILNNDEIWRIVCLASENQDFRAPSTWRPSVSTWKLFTVIASNTDFTCSI